MKADMTTLEITVEKVYKEDNLSGQTLYKVVGSVPTISPSLKAKRSKILKDPIVMTKDHSVETTTGYKKPEELLKGDVIISRINLLSNKEY